MCLIPNSLCKVKKVMILRKRYIMFPFHTVLHSHCVGQLGMIHTLWIWCSMEWKRNILLRHWAIEIFFWCRSMWHDTREWHVTRPRKPNNVFGRLEGEKNRGWKRIDIIIDKCDPSFANFKDLNTHWRKFDYLIFFIIYFYKCKWNL